MCEKKQKKNVCVRGEKEKEKSCIILSNGNVLCVSSFFGLFFALDICISLSIDVTSKQAYHNI